MDADKAAKSSTIAVDPLRWVVHDGLYEDLLVNYCTVLDKV